MMVEPWRWCCGGGGVVIDDGGAIEVEVWCGGGGGVVIGDGGAVGIMPSLKSLKKSDCWKEIIKKD